MELNGKCKEEFDKWYLEVCEEEDLIRFYSKYLTPNMRYGVYVDFFDSVGLDINIERGFEKINGFVYYAIIRFAESYSCKTRQEARQSAIQKANEIFNNR